MHLSPSLGNPQIMSGSLNSADVNLPRFRGHDRRVSRTENDRENGAEAKPVRARGGKFIAQNTTTAKTRKIRRLRGIQLEKDVRVRVSASRLGH